MRKIKFKVLRLIKIDDFIYVRNVELLIVIYLKLTKKLVNT